jgi:hypothetical protein
MWRMKTSLSLLVGTLIAVSAHAASPKPLEPLGFLLGEWVASGSGQPGEASGSATFARDLQDRVLIRKSYAEYPATAQAPASRHDDLMLIYASADSTVQADYYDSEGHVIHYTASVPAPGAVVFVSGASEGGPRFRLSYKLNADDILEGEFAISPPGKPDEFAPYLKWKSHRAAAQGDTKP